ncbi:MAG TPA: SDR family NAD(P)-dependent oxidoreductase [Steroidobacteraceae bacterium]|jgi:NAD(P)-dependent dehydrogenase (short-subunit alcohol dehydrogenase family)|nr:SDR family NAD(P)-dependent oxidoreductase [Steroidobacteraceae bacterium]
MASRSSSRRSVVVTGAFGNLGLAVARTFRDRGEAVALLGHSQPAAQVMAEFPAPHCVLGGVDLTRVTSVNTAMETVRAKLGSIDVLVNIAGGFRWQTLEQGDIEGWDAMFASNLKTAVVSTRAALPGLLASPAGRIINVGAGAAERAAGVGMGAYTASKAGVHKLTESLAQELKDRGITVNAVLPGIIDTPQNRADMPKADYSRWVPPAAIAAVIAFLASEQAAAVTGALLPVYGRG